MDRDMSTALWQQLKEELFPWTLVPLTTYGFFMSFYGLGFRDALSPLLALFGLAILFYVAVVFILSRRHCPLAAWLNVLAFMCVAIAAWRWFPNSNAYHALLIPVVVASMTLGTTASVVVSTLGSMVLGFVLVGSPHGRVSHP